MRGTQLIYGLHAVRAMLTQHPERVLRVRIVERRDDARARSIEELAHRHGRPVERIDAAALRKLLGEVSHQGIAADILPLPQWSEDDLLGEITSATRAVVLALDGIQDPHNLGACLRTADACGVRAVLVPRDRAAQLTAAARKVAAGAAESVPVVPVTNLVRSLRLLKEAGLWVFGADAAASLEAYQADLTGAIALVLGAEGSGLRQLTRQTCDHLVRLPQLGTVESLNVSVAAGMLLYEAVRQRASRPSAPATASS